MVLASKCMQGRSKVKSKLTHLVAMSMPTGLSTSCSTECFYQRPNHASAHLSY